MDKGQTNNPNLTPSSYPTKFWGLLAMVAPTAHITQQNFLIGSSSKIEGFHWSRQCHQYLGPYTISHNKSLSHIPLTHIFMSHISLFVEESSSIQYWR